MRSVAGNIVANTPTTLSVSFFTFVFSVGYMIWPPKAGFGPEPILAYYIAIAGVLQFFVLLLVLVTARFLEAVGDKG